MRKIFVGGLFATSLLFASASFAIEGDWTSGCLMFEDEEGNVSSEEIVYHFESPLFSADINLFAGGECGTEIATFVASGPVSFGTSDAGMTTVDISTDSLFLIPKHPAVAQNLNTNQFCGFTDWAADGIGKEVIECESYAEARGTYYTIAEIGDDGKLYFGEPTESNDGSSPSTRPVDLGDFGFSPVGGLL